MVPISKAAEILGVSIDTVRRWEKAGKITAERSEGGHRLFSVDKLETYKRLPFSSRRGVIRPCFS